MLFLCSISRAGPSNLTSCSWRQAVPYGEIEAVSRICPLVEGRRWGARLLPGARGAGGALETRVLSPCQHWGVRGRRCLPADKVLTVGLADVLFVYFLKEKATLCTLARVALPQDPGPLAALKSFSSFPPEQQRAVEPRASPSKKLLYNQLPQVASVAPR